MTDSLSYEEQQSRVIHEVQQALGELDRDLNVPLARGAVISGLIAVAAAVARNPRFIDEEEMTKRHFVKLAERAYVVAKKVTISREN